jgi:Spy/CpxP family protein refolding chaperone
MRRTLFTFGYAAGILLAASFSLRAEPAGAALNPPAARGSLAAAGQNNVAGYALGGPVGVMTDEQRASYQTTLRAMHGRIAELDAKLRVARQDVLDTALTTKFDENVIREKALAAARIEAELAVIRAKALSQVQPPLSAEQIEKIKSGRPGPMRPLERPPRGESRAGTNHDDNGLPPKQ